MPINIADYTLLGFIGGVALFASVYLIGLKKTASLIALRE
jgi:hypothetical protein